MTNKQEEQLDVLSNITLRKLQSLDSLSHTWIDPDQWEEIRHTIRVSLKLGWFLGKSNGKKEEQLANKKRVRKERQNGAIDGRRLKKKTSRGSRCA